MGLEIKRLTNLKWKTDGGYCVTSGYGLYLQGKGYLAFDADGLETPYSPYGGRKTLQLIIDAGGLTDYSEVSFINPIEERSVAK